jgi:glycosyltransferase involved in cell wall biosynthesis
MNRPLISVAIPAYNEAPNLDELFERLRAVFQVNSDKYDFAMKEKFKYEEQRQTLRNYIIFKAKKVF